MKKQQLDIARPFDQGDLNMEEVAEEIARGGICLACGAGWTSDDDSIDPDSLVLRHHIDCAYFLYGPATLSEQLAVLRASATLLQVVIDRQERHDPRGIAMVTAKIQSQLVEFINRVES